MLDLAKSGRISLADVLARRSLAKQVAIADHQIYKLTSHLVSERSLKRVATSSAAWPVLAATHVRVPDRNASRLCSQKLSAECLLSFQQGQPKPASSSFKSNTKRSQA